MRDEHEVFDNTRLRFMRKLIDKSPDADIEVAFDRIDEAAYIAIYGGDDPLSIREEDTKRGATPNGFYAHKKWRLNHGGWTIDQIKDD